MPQPSDKENLKEPEKKLSSKEPSLSERLTGTDSDINAYSIAPIPASAGQPKNDRSFLKDSSKTISTSDSPITSVPFEYAGFFRRYASAVIDDFFLYWLVIGLVLMLAAANMLLMHFVPRLLGVDFSRQMFDFANAMIWVPGILLTIGICWLYCAGLESSSMEATPGKRLLGVRVLDIDGRRLTFWKSTRKALVPALLGLVALVAWLATMFTIGSIKGPFAVLGVCIFVVTGLISVAAFFAAFLGNCFFINKKNQTVHDLLSKRIVVKRAKDAPSKSFWARFSLLPLERRILALLLFSFVFLVFEIMIGHYCNVESKNLTTGELILNTSGHVWRAKKTLQAGSILDFKDCYKATLPLFQTPPFALDPAAKLGRVLICGDISPDAILTYNCVVPKTVGISKIISIEPIQESNYSLSRLYGARPLYAQSKNHVDYHLNALKSKYPGEEWLINSWIKGFGPVAAVPDEIDELRTAAVEGNKKKNYAAALSSSDKALSLLFEKYLRQNPTGDVTPESQSVEEAEETAPKKQKTLPGMRPSEVVERAIKDSKMLPETFPFTVLSAEYRAELIDLLMQRSIAQTGLKHDAKGKVDSANCISILKSLHQDSLAERKEEFLGLPDLDGGTNSDSSDAKDDDSNAKADGSVDTKADANTNLKADARTDSTDANSNANSDANSNAQASADDSSTSIDADTATYLSMLARSDEKRYKDFLQHISKQLGK